ncbi:MAG: hypothetical protein MJ054_00915 [Clostridia bacterium]|nr:hypothetical protein [Clostridia bacterium]
MELNPVIEVIYAAFKLELANDFFLENNKLFITLKNKHRVVITAPQVSSTTALSQDTVPTTKNTHTYHYIHQDDFVEEKRPSGLLLLNNIEECYAYIDDICQNLLNVPVRNFEVTFPDGTIYLIKITEFNE